MDKLPPILFLVIVIILGQTNSFDLTILREEQLNIQAELLAQSPILITEKDKIAQKLSVIQVEVDEIKQAIEVIFKNESKNAIKIAYCESRFKPDAINWDDVSITGMPSWGIFQINSHKFEGWDNVYINVKIAKKMYDERDWQPWKNCAKKELGLVF